MRRYAALLIALGLLAPRYAACAENPSATNRGPLDEYVSAPDPAYKWELVKTIEGPLSKTAVIKLTSQQWRTEQDVNRPVWDHWLTIVRPAKMKSNKAFLVVAGGSHDRPAPDGASAVVARIAESTGSVVAELKGIPNQPLIFHGDGVPRKEDDLIGYGWNQFLERGDPAWLPRLPMVKSVARAMDCIQEWSAGDGAEVEKFVVAGASKRGWTTWMIAAVDPRVEAIVPIVIDVLNVHDSMRHHASVYGFWAKAVGNYYQHRILQRPTHPRLRELYAVEDPFNYLDRLTMPKYIVNGAGDQFFVPDSSQFYYDKLQGEKHLRYVPNADHGVDSDISAVTSMVAFYQMLLAERPRPTLAWSFQEDGSIRLQSDVAPTQVTLWQASNAKARDFRVATIGKAYRSTTLQPEADGSWVARLTAPAEGWTAAFVEASYDSGGPFPFIQTTAVRVLPEIRPFEGVDLATVEYEGHLAPAASAAGGR